MASRKQPDSSLPPLPAWRRYVVVCCALLFALFSTAQAAHIHRELHSNERTDVKASTGVSSDGGDAQCPLCAVAHSALPSPSPVAVDQLTVVAKVLVAFPAASKSDPWHFARLSRPPPAFFPL